MIASGLVQNVEFGSAKSWRKISLVVWFHFPIVLFKTCRLPAQEGIITTTVYLLSFLVMPANPTNAKFLRTDCERYFQITAGTNTRIF